MRNFEKSIKIEISANQIAQQLLLNMLPEFKHKEVVVESIISALPDEGLLSLYNALNGYITEINFSIGDMIEVQDLKSFGFWKRTNEDDGEWCCRPIHSAKVIDIDLYAADKIAISYEVPAPAGKGFITNTERVSHLRCANIATVGKIDLRK